MKSNKTTAAAGKRLEIRIGGAIPSLCMAYPVKPIPRMLPTQNIDPYRETPLPTFPAGSRSTTSEGPIPWGTLRKPNRAANDRNCQRKRENPRRRRLALITAQEAIKTHRRPIRSESRPMTRDKPMDTKPFTAAVKVIADF
jgi:hypothetical protein